MKLKTHTPIQLTIDNRSKYLKNFEETDKIKFKSNLNIILNQIKQIENLVNEFLILLGYLNQ